MNDQEMVKKLESLCSAYATNNNTMVSSLEPIATSIGQELDRKGGIQEMRRIFNMVSQQQGKRTLEMHWGGIGDWEG